MAGNLSYSPAAPPLLDLALRQHAQTGAKGRLAGEMAYAASTWPQARRVVYKAEALEQGPNLRFVVTTRADAPLALYDWHVQRGTPERPNSG
jgi:Transposase DDE domain group 1